MESKQAKTPSLNNKTKILCFDLETNGLHGEVFAIGAVVIDGESKVTDNFTGRTKIVGLVDPWVEKHVVPSIENMTISHKNYRDLREAFWAWFVTAEAESDYVLVSNGYPVEYRFLLKCQEENLTERYWQHPFPILDLTSLLLQAGDIQSIKTRLLSEIGKSEKFLPHNPLDDAKKSALLAFESLRLTGRIK